MVVAMPPAMFERCFVVVLTIFLGFEKVCGSDLGFRVGSAIVDVSPIAFPVAVNGGMTSQTADKIRSPLNARAIVLEKGDEKLAIVVVDSCMMPRVLLDEIKAMASAQTGIAADHMMISATHTHSAAASMSCLGTDADPDYQSYLRIKVAEAIEAAQKNLEPATVGWGSIDASNYMAIRRWIRRPDRMGDDPFGNRTVRANMHAGRIWDDVTGTSGPEDPELSLIGFKTLSGETIAVLGNLSMHYFSGVEPISADYFGLYCESLQQRLVEQNAQGHPVVGIMSHGCSGDVWRMDYTKQTPAEFETISIEKYTSGLVDLTLQAMESMEFSRPESLGMKEQRLRLKYRVPNAQLLQWSRQIVEKMGERLPSTTEEVYAREQIYLHEAQETEVVVQAIRIGQIGIVTTPTETYALTGMKLKYQSPLPHTMVIELAGGGDGYIPPPEQHVLGGYNTWPARSAGLETTAEPKIVESGLRLLETLADAPRIPYGTLQTPDSVLEKCNKSLAYWRFDDMQGPRARDASPFGHDGIYEPGVVFFLEGMAASDYSKPNFPNRAAHFAGGRMQARIGELPDSYELSLWIWNGMPSDAREITGWFYSRGTDYARPANAEQLGIGGTGDHSGKLILQLGTDELVAGVTEIQRWSWNHVRMVRTQKSIIVYLNDAEVPEIDCAVRDAAPVWADVLFFGGSSDGKFLWEGRLDEASIVAIE